MYELKGIEIMDDKLLIIDGMNLLFQMFYGMPSRITGKDGQAIHGVLGFIGALIKMIKMTEPTHIIALFDSEHEKNPRTELISEYKANRRDYTDAPKEDNPFSQLDDIYRALDCMNIFHTEIIDGETDDAAASYAITYGKEMQIVVASFDSDFFQLINENVTVLRYRGDKSYFCDNAFIMDKFGITSEQYADFKSLTGDVSDNIKGADKIGLKTAANLLSRFGSLRLIIENADEIERLSVRESIKQNIERLNNNYRVIKLNNGAAMPVKPEKLKYIYDGISTNDVLKSIGIR